VRPAYQHLQQQRHAPHEASRTESQPSQHHNEYLPSAPPTQWERTAMTGGRGRAEAWGGAAAEGGSAHDRYSSAPPVAASLSPMPEKPGGSASGPRLSGPSGSPGLAPTLHPLAAQAFAAAAAAGHGEAASRAPSRPAIIGRGGSAGGPAGWTYGPPSGQLPMPLDSNREPSRPESDEASLASRLASMRLARSVERSPRSTPPPAQGHGAGRPELTRLEQRSDRWSSDRRAGRGHAVGR
jgi:hypothetical protein